MARELYERSGYRLEAKFIFIHKYKILHWYFCTLHYIKVNTKVVRQIQFVMNNSIINPDASVVAGYSYADRIQALRETKLHQTREKLKNGFMDHDDHGIVPVPPGFTWKPVANHPNGQYYGPLGWGACFRDLTEKHPVYVDPNDALAGRYMYCMYNMREIPWKPEFDYSHLTPEQKLYGIVSGIGAPHHFCKDYRIAMDLGWGGLLRKVRDSLKRHFGDHDIEEFLRGAEMVVLGMQNWMQRTAEKAATMAAAEERSDVRRNLKEISEMNFHLVSETPRTFREACQMIVWTNMASRIYNGDGAGGQLDTLLFPYYERDLAAGILDDEQAVFILACLLVNDPLYYQLGGPGVDGDDQTNPVSYLILEAGHQMRIACNLTVRVHDGLDPEFYAKAVRHLFEDRLGWPRFCGDQSLISGFMKNGYSVELARQRIATGCHWMAIPGREYTINDCVKINTAKVFEVAWNEMIEDRSVSPGLDELWARFQKHLSCAVKCTARGLDFHLAHQKDSSPELVISLFCHGPIEKGIDASGGGVEYYNMCVDGSALASVADSFATLEQRVVMEERLSWYDVDDHLRANFAGVEGERVRLMFKNSERYGRGGSIGDHWAEKVSKLFTELVKSGPTPDGHNMIPGWFSWSNTIAMGKEVGAMPNGRRAGEPISHGANPDPGFRRDGAPTAMASAIAAIQPGYGNTAPMQLEMDPGLSEEEGGLDRVASLIRTHFNLGGTLFNINILNEEKLMAAHRDPMAHQDLVVRVTGFSAFFCTLSPEFRQLVVNRFIAEK